MFLSFVNGVGFFFYDYDKIPEKNGLKEKRVISGFRCFSTWMVDAIAVGT